MKSYDHIDQIIDEADIHDLACDFIEQEVGRFHFADNWLKFKESKHVEPKRYIRLWLQSINEDPYRADTVYDTVEEMSKTTLGWVNGCDDEKAKKLLKKK